MSNTIDWLNQNQGLLTVISILLPSGIITWFLKRKGRRRIRNFSQDSKIFVIGSHNTIEGQSINKAKNTVIVPQIKQSPIVQCEITITTIDGIGDCLNFQFINKQHLVKIDDLEILLSECKQKSDGTYDLTDSQINNLLCLFRLFNPNGLNLSYEENLETTIAKELSSKDITIEIETSIDIAKRIPFQKLKNYHFGVNNYSLGVYVNKK